MLKFTLEGLESLAKQSRLPMELLQTCVADCNSAAVVEKQSTLVDPRE